MIENDSEIDFKNFNDVGKFIVGLQDDLEILALHLRDAKNKIANLEEKIIKLPPPEAMQKETKKENSNIDYYKLLMSDDMVEREKRMETNILNSLRNSLIPPKNNSQILINIGLGVGILIVLVILIILRSS